MTSRPNIPPSSGPPRLPISVKGEWRASRALPSPTSPRSPFRQHHPHHHHQHPHHQKQNQLHPSPRHHLPLPSSPARPWEDGYTTSDMYAPAPASAPAPNPDRAHSDQPMHFWTPHLSEPTLPLSAGPTPRRSVAEHGLALPLPPRSLSTSELPRNPNGTKKQQSGRKRTACDRCKRQKSSCIEAYVEDPSTGRRHPAPDEKRCQRCVEKGVVECIITTGNDSYARPRSPRMVRHPNSASASEPPIIPPPLILSEPHPRAAFAAPPPPPSTVTDPEIAVSKAISPESENQSQLSWGSVSASASVSGSGPGKQLFEEDASVRTKPVRAATPGSEGQGRGRVYFGNSHMGPAFVQEFVNAPRDNGDMVSVPAPSPRRRRPDYRAEKLLKHLPGNEKEMDRYVDRFFTKYNCWADVIDENDFRVMYRLFKRDHCFGTLAHRDAADLRDLALLLMVLAFGVILDHAPKEEVANQNTSILAAISSEDERERVKAWREEMSSFWAALAKESLVDAQSASMGETINSISAWVLVAWYAIHNRRAEEGWSVLGQAARQAMASGFHIDGSHRMFQSSDMAPKEIEQRRRLWAHMVIIDTSVSLYLGRPHAVFGGQQYTSQEPANIAGEDLIDPPPVSQQLVDDATDRSPWELDLSSVYLDGVRGRPLHTPTRSTFLILHLRLAYVIGRMQLQCFGLKPRKHGKDVVECEAMFEAWAQALPPHFRLKATDKSLDDTKGYEWIKHHRKNLHSKYYIARISLHRPYLLAAEGSEQEGKRGARSASGSPDSWTSEYKMSQDACIVSAVADLNLRTQTDEADPLDRFKWMTVASGFNPALIMGIVCFHHDQHHKYQVQELLRLLEKYLEVESKTLRKGPVLEDELRALKFLHKSAKVHIKLGDRRGTKEKRRSSDDTDGGDGEKEPERAVKRSRPAPIRPFTTSTPLTIAASVPPHTASASLPITTPATAPIVPPPAPVGPVQSISYFPNIPPFLQGQIKDFSFGDTNTMSFNEQFGLNTVQSQHGWPFQPDWPAGNMAGGTDLPLVSHPDAWSASTSNNAMGTFTQVMSTFNKAGQDVSPEQALADLPFVDHQQHQHHPPPGTIQPSLLFGLGNTDFVIPNQVVVESGSSAAATGQMGLTQAWAATQSAATHHMERTDVRIQHP